MLPAARACEALAWRSMQLLARRASHSQASSSSAAAEPELDLDWRPEGDLGDQHSKQRWFHDARQASLMGRRRLSDNAWSVLPQRAAGQVDATRAVVDVRMKAVQGRGMLMAFAEWGRAPLVLGHELREWLKAVEGSPESNDELENRCAALARQVLDLYGCMQLEDLRPLVSQALRAAMQDELTYLAVAHMPLGRYPQECKWEVRNKMLLARGLWPAEAMAPWGGAEVDSAPPGLDSLGMGCGPLWEVAAVHLGGSWKLRYATVRDNLYIGSAEGSTSALRLGPMADYIGMGGTHMSALQAGDWLFFRGPLPQQPAETTLGLPWRVLLWG